MRGGPGRSVAVGTAVGARVGGMGVRVGVDVGVSVASGTSCGMRPIVGVGEDSVVGDGVDGSSVGVAASAIETIVGVSVGSGGT